MSSTKDKTKFTLTSAHAENGGTSARSRSRSLSVENSQLVTRTYRNSVSASQVSLSSDSGSRPESRTFSETVEETVSPLLSSTPISTNSFLERFLRIARARVNGDIV